MGTRVAAISLRSVVEVAAPADALYARFFDERTLRSCIPGCREFAPTEPGLYRVTFEVAAGPFRGTYQMRVNVTQETPGGSYRLEATPLAGAGPSGGGTITLDGHPGGTLVTISGAADIPGLGRLAAFAATPLARRMVARFFACVAAQVAVR